MKTLTLLAPPFLHKIFQKRYRLGTSGIPPEAIAVASLAISMKCNRYLMTMDYPFKSLVSMKSATKLEMVPSQQIERFLGYRIRKKQMCGQPGTLPIGMYKFWTPIIKCNTLVSTAIFGSKPSASAFVSINSRK